MDYRAAELSGHFNGYFLFLIISPVDMYASMCFDHKFSDRSGPSNPLSNAVTPPAPNALHGQSPSSGNSSTLLFVIGGMTTLKKATKNFHPANLLGRGGFGPVYRYRKLHDGRLVAVKKLSLDKSQQGESEFLSEVKMITSIQQKNLVRLLGCCSDGPQRLLVYEYMKNRSLDLIVYGNSDKFLDWNTRFQIILGIARGLQYLHEDPHLRIVHRDIKASNILLDDKFQPRISDFGLARFFPEDQAYLSMHSPELCKHSTNIGVQMKESTLGAIDWLSTYSLLNFPLSPVQRLYTAPEYAIKGELSEKADIYSFGVLVLEIISSRKNTDLSLPSEMQYLPEYAWKFYERSESDGSGRSEIA
ncbi:hypothetical protein NC651_015458 [Populus alba x Populus x berolinensis]|nr:hypothetical protein NC651_015458 [Populus alba x Populus x berolinensis]